MNTIVLTTTQSRKIKRALKALEEARKEVSLSPENKVNDDEGINWYLEDCGNLYLMNGSTHDGYKQGANYENVIEVFSFNNSSGGAC